eukprot:c23471_g3_i1 orf=467-3109(-)
MVEGRAFSSRSWLAAARRELLEKAGDVGVSGRKVPWSRVQCLGHCSGSCHSDEDHEGLRYGNCPFSKVCPDMAGSTDVKKQVKLLRRIGEENQAVDLMLMGKLPLSPTSVSSLLQVCMDRKDLAIGRRLHILLGAAHDFEGAALVRDQLIRLFASCGNLIEANLLFCSASRPSSCTWQAIISAHLTYGESKKALELYQMMLEEGSRASKYIYSCVLKACGCIGAVVQGEILHDEIIKREFQSQVIVVNALVDMYAKCGHMEGALKVFSDLLDKDVVSWNAVIAGSTQHGDGLLAISLFGKMQQEGTCPDLVTYLCVSKACGCLNALDQGKHIHCQAGNCGKEMDVILGSSLVDMYGKCRDLKLAQELFDALPERNVVSWNGLIGGYALQDFGSHALELFQKMKDDGLRPNSITFLCLLKACGKMGSLEQGENLHALILKNQLESNEAIGNALVDMYAKCSKLDLAQRVFYELPNRSVVSWGALISGYCENGCGLRALELFERMQQEHINPDRVIFLCALKACASLESIASGLQIHRLVIESGLENDVMVGNALLDMYAKCGRLEEARKVFDRLRNLDVVSCNTMIAANLQNGQSFCALEILELMGCKGIKADKVTFLSSLKACGSIGAIGQAKLIHEQIMRDALESDIVVGTTLVDMYAKFGNLKEADNVFNRLPNPNLVSWSALIVGYAQQGKIFDALESMREMKKQGLTPDGKIYVTLFMACSHAGQVDEGYRHFRNMISHGIVPTVEHFNCLVELLSRAGRLKEAEKILQSMPASADVAGWMSLLTACKAYGNSQLGTSCFSQALKLKSGATPEYVPSKPHFYADGPLREADHNLEGFFNTQRKPQKAGVDDRKNLCEFIPRPYFVGLTPLNSCQVW